MTKFKNSILDKLTPKDRLFLKENLDMEKQIYLDVTYYIQIQKCSSNISAVEKELGIIKPTQRPDLDNYDKFLLDSLHNVFYNDDSQVIDIHSRKLYSLQPRTEITIRMEILKTQEE